MTFVERALVAMGARQAREENAWSTVVAPTLSRVGPGSPWVAAARRKVALTHAVMRQALRDILDALGGEIPYLILKGEPLGRELFGDSSHRSSGDIDLLVLPGDYEEVRRRLLALGYVPKNAEGPRMWAHNQEEFRHEVHGASVEIHWILALPAMPAMSPLPLFETRRRFSLDEDLQPYVLRGDWMGIHLALHFQQHSGFAKGLLDMAAWCDQIAPALDRGCFLDKASRLRLQGVVQWPLHTLEILCGERPPMYLEEVDPSVRWWATISADALRDCLSRPYTGGLRDCLAALNPTMGPAVWVSIQSLAMMVVDGTPLQKGVACLRPILDGPHFVGRFFHRMQWGTRPFVVPGRRRR